MPDGTLVRTGNSSQPERRYIPVASLSGQSLGPDLSLIRSFHRGPDGFVALATKRAGEWEELGAIHVPNLDDGQLMIPELLDQLALDGYFSLNTSFRRGYGRPVGTRKVRMPLPLHHPELGPIAQDNPGATYEVEQTIYSNLHPTTKLPFAQHTHDSLRWLNVCHVDVDCYKVGLSVPETMAAILTMQDEGRLPPATMLMRSGRGLWVFWYLLDPDNPLTGSKDLFNATHTPTTPQRAHPRAMAMYARVQRALTDRLAHLGADLVALDAARFAPVPGTVKSSSNLRVDVWRQEWEPGRGIAYTLDQLAHALQLEPLAPRHPVIAAALEMDPATDAAKSAVKRRGWVALHQYLLRDFESLLALRNGGFAPGIRHHAAYLYAVVLRRNGMSAADIEQRIAAVARRSPGRTPEDAFTATEVGEVVRQACKSKVTGLRYANLFASLRVTPQEATYLTHIKPTAPAKPATRRAPQDRQAAVQAIVQRLGRVPSTREMAGYTAAQGFPGNHTRIANDYKVLGLTPAKKAGRPKKLSLF